MKKTLDLQDFKSIINIMNENIQTNVNLLSNLDSVIGDGDHGMSMSKSFKNAINSLNNENVQTIPELLRVMGKSILSSVGGVTGVVFGYFFIEMGKNLSPEKKEVNLEDFYFMLSKSLEVSMKLGSGAKPGDKTMIDAFYPAVESLKDSIDNNLTLSEAFKEMSIAAENGALSTKEMIAKVGRAKYLGQRSIGYQDAGATSLYLILKSFNDYLETQNKKG
ncbi:MAG: dihydroxyacetone kinase subunit DhaL [Actinobacteria bacterium]|nr:dihydroxyacetone kinase subunit DhaL [Actinomycetota bacterium]